jgi:hemerythrin
MDSQHQQLLEFCSRLADCLDRDDAGANDEFHSIISDLAYYARVHLDAEEKLLANLNYPELAEHLREHHAFRTALADMLMDATFGKLTKQDLLNFIIAWWRTHILTADMRYKDCMK